MSISKIKINLVSKKDRSYKILIGANLLNNFYENIKDLPQAEKYIIITDNKIKKLYGLDLQKQLKSKGLTVKLLSFPAGEASKSQSVKTKLDHE